MVKFIKQIIDKSRLVWNDPVNLRQQNQTSLNLSKFLLSNPVNSRQTKLDKSELVLNNPVNIFQYTVFPRIVSTLE